MSEPTVRRAATPRELFEQAGFTSSGAWANIVRDAQDGPATRATRATSTKARAKR